MAGPKKEWVSTPEQPTPDRAKGESRGIDDWLFEDDNDWVRPEYMKTKAQIDKEEKAIDALLDGDDTLFNELEY